MSQVDMLIEKLEKVEMHASDKVWRDISGVLTDALGKLADLLPSKVYPRGLVTTSPQEWHDLTTFVENQAHLNATTFDVSDPIHIDGLISVMQIMVPFYKRGVQSNLVRDFVNIHVLPQFHKLLEDRKLDFLKALAEISFFTRAPVSNHTLRSMGEILKMYMPSSSKGSAFNVEKSSTHVECILYVFHHLAHKAENTKTATELCKQLRERLKNVTLMTSPRLEELRINLSNDDKELRGATGWVRDLKFLAEMKKEKTVLLAKKISFTGDKRVNLSWKEARKPPLVSEITNTQYPKVPNRRYKVNSLPKETQECLSEDFMCKVSKSQALALGDLEEGQLRNEDGEFRFHDDKQISAIRDQEFHLLCAAYVATDLASSRRYIHKLDDENITLCTWYLCAHTDSKALGKDPRADPNHHHCYGSSIENFLGHIQAHGVPREIFGKFDCKNHHPPTAEDPWKSLRKIKAVRSIPTFQEAMRELRKGGPIGADLLYYTGLFELRNGIYYGPHQNSSTFRAYHAVFIEAIKEMNGELVAVCKLSNSLDAGDEGYVYVSLATLYFPVSAVGESQKAVRGISQPSHLLSNFVTIELEGEEKPEKRHDPSSTHKRTRDPSPHRRSRYSDSGRPSERYSNFINRTEFLFCSSDTSAWGLMNTYTGHSVGAKKGLVQSLQFSLIRSFWKGRSLG
ncbi:hypothetical protein Bca101_076293 [Brassica carinata]